MIQEHGEGQSTYDPSIAELASETGLEEYQVKRALEAATPLSSLESPVGEDGKLGDFIEDKSQRRPYEEVHQGEIRGYVHTLISTLTERERAVLTYRFGLNGCQEHTLEEVGEKYKVTRERIRQIEAKALKKLRHPAKAKYLIGLRESLNP